MSRSTPRGANVTLAASFSGPATATMFEAFGQVPSPSEHDNAASDPSAASQSILLAGTEAGAYYVDLNNPTSTAQSYTLAATAATSGISSMSPSSAAYIFYCFPGSVAEALVRHAHATLNPCPLGEGGIPPYRGSHLNETIYGIGFSPASTASSACTGSSIPIQRQLQQAPRTSSAQTLRAHFRPGAVGDWKLHSTPNVYLYRGEQYDPDLGLYYLRARYYNPATGRFMSRDPLDPDLRDANGIPADPKYLHKYLYANGDPMSMGLIGWGARMKRGYVRYRFLD